MAKKLVIVESPAKARTLNRILGDTYSIKASMGHVRDLPKYALGIDIENDFTPVYSIIKEKKKMVTELKEAAQKASAIYLATDPDREGEAISWHLIEATGLNEDNKKIHRVTFHEITQDAVMQAFQHPRNIDSNLVDAQQARRLLDRLVGYKLSPLLWKKVQRGLSAGRVQSATVKIVVDREREITNFIEKEYWIIEVELAKKIIETNSSHFRALLTGTADGKTINITNKNDAAEITGELEKASYIVRASQVKEIPRQPAPPFTTSTMQQEAWRRLHYTAKYTMSIAQQLYEGIDIGDEGSAGLITYMRTDSTHVAPSAITETREYIEKKYGLKFLPERTRVFSKKNKWTQEAHEAIRPTKINREPADVKSYLKPEQFKLYELIWKRMVASQMSAALFDTNTIDIDASCKSPLKSYLLRATSSANKFPGFMVLYTEGKDEDAVEDERIFRLPKLAKGDNLKMISVFPEQRFTIPPQRYTEATLIKALEQKGIGRPSTYAPILSTIQERGYVHKESGRFVPDEIGIIVNDLLVKNFPKIVDPAFTAQMEENLDDIAHGKKEWISVLKSFYKPFDDTLKKADKVIEKIFKDEETDKICSECGKPMVIKTGRFGKFIACTGYPKCKNKMPLDKENNSGTNQTNRGEETKEICPVCGKPMVIKCGRFGNFLACTGYPECKKTMPLSKKIGILCPECGERKKGELVERISKKKRRFYGCNRYPECKFITSQKPLPQPCPECGKLLVSYRKDMVKCTSCGYKDNLAEIEVAGVAS